MSGSTYMPKRRWRAGVVALLLVTAAGLIPVASASATESVDAVLEWNLNAVNALSNGGAADPPGAGYTPPVASIYLAMVQAAVYDAVNAIDGGHQPYLGGLEAPASASKAAAVAKAARDVLYNVTPPLPDNVRASIQAKYQAFIDAIPDSAAKTDGIATGAAAAAILLNDRAGDGRFSSNFSFHPENKIGSWRPELPSGVSDPFAWVSNVRPFTLLETGQFRTKGPDDLKSHQYAVDYEEVRTMGSATGSNRTTDQTNEALFFAGNPLIMMNQAFREVSTARGLSTVDNARLFGMTALSSSDALIGCWDDKDYWSFWRPITAIREAANDGNKWTQPNPTTWTPLLATPPYPDEPSGYNCFTGAMMNAAKRFFDTDWVAFRLVHPVSGAVRNYTSFSSVPRDTIDARIWLGLHFRNADTDGARLGKQTAKWVDTHFFGAVH